MGKIKRRLKRNPYGKYCECGCGQEVKPGNKFIFAHHTQYQSKETRQKISLGILKYHKNKTKGVLPTSKLCECGCGNYTTPGSRFISGHNSRCRLEEVAEKISKTLKGHSVSEETKLKISLAHIGKNHSEETKKKISLKTLREKNGNWKGRKIIKCEVCGTKIEVGINSPQIVCCKKCDGIRRSIIYIGPKSSQWRGGISHEPYCYDWSIIKEYVRERDGDICLNPSCLGNTRTEEGKDICIHHINYNKKNCHPNNLISVCRSCNARANFDRTFWKEWYKTIIVKRYNYKLECVGKRRSDE